MVDSPYFSVYPFPRLHFFGGIPVNGVPVPLDRQHQGGKNYLFHALIPQDVLEREPRNTVLSFRTDELGSQQNLEHRGPNWKRGLVFDWLTVEPLRRESSITVDFDEAVQGAGWLPIADRSRAWTIADQATLNLPLVVENEMELTFQIVWFDEQEILDSLSLEVNGVPVPLDRQHQGGKNYLFHALIPQDVLEQAPMMTVLTFETDEIHSPKELGIGEAEWARGLVFDWLTVEPQSDE